MSFGSGLADRDHCPRHRAAARRQPDAQGELEVEVLRRCRVQRGGADEVRRQANYQQSQQRHSA